jgi:hypothetical protein
MEDFSIPEKKVPDRKEHFENRENVVGQLKHKKGVLLSVGVVVPVHALVRDYPVNRDE